jgi:integrase
MPHKRKDSSFWWASFTDADGKRVRCSTGTTQKKEAVALESKWKAEAFRGKAWGDKPTRSLGDLMLEYMTATESKPSSDRDAYSAERLLDFFGANRDLASLKSSDITQYQKHRLKMVSAGTYNKEVGLLSAAINYANSEWDWRLSNPCKGKRLAEATGKTVYLTRQEAAALIDAVDRKASHLVDLIDLAIQTGTRKAELLKLEWDRIDWANNEIILEAKHTKSAKPRRVPLNASARSVLIRRAGVRSECCPGTPWVFFHITRLRNSEVGDRIKDVKTAMRSACKRVGLEGVSFHTLRHTCASWLGQMSGVEALTIRDLLGHSSITMTDRYMHSDQADIHDAVRKLKPIRSRFGHVDH